MQVCTASGSTAPCRCSAVNALCRILAVHGHQAAIKQELQAAQGLSTLVFILGRTTLPLSARTAAAACLYSYLAPQAAGAAGSEGGGQAGVTNQQGSMTSTRFAATPSCGIC